MVYIVDRCYASNHVDECIIVKNSHLSIEEMINLVGALGNHYAECTQQRKCQPRDILNILCSEQIYCKDKKYKYVRELGFIERRVYSPVLSTVFLLNGELVIWIDIEEAMDYTYGRKWTVLANYFTKDDIELIKSKWQKFLKN